MKPLLVRSAVLALAAALAASACSDIETRVNRPGDDQPFFRIYFEVLSEQSSGSGTSVQLNDDQGNTIALNEVAFVVREVEIGRVAGPCEDASAPDEDDGDACHELTVEPRLLAAPVEQRETALTNQAFPVTDGSYDRLEFDIQVATNEDSNVVGQNPQLVDESVLIRGAYNGSTFAVTLDPENDYQLDFAQSIQTEVGAVSRVTLQVSMDGWFRAEDGSLIDPAELESSPELEDRVEGQILDSFSIALGPPQ